MNIILAPFAALLKLLYGLTSNYGLAIILFGLVFKIVLFPISIRGRKSMLDMTRLSDKQKVLQEKYIRDRQKYSEELQKLYEAEGVKPSGGCLWSLIPMPILMALYFIISQPFTYLMDLSGDQITQLTQFILGTAETARNSQLTIAQDVFTRFGEVQAALPEIAGKISAQGGPIDFTFFGLNLSKTPNFMFWKGEISWATTGLALIPILSAVFALISMRTSTFSSNKALGRKAKVDTQNKQMMFMQPLISLWLGFTLPAALSLYWTANSVFAIAQEFCSIGILRKHVEKKRVETEQRAVLQKELERENRQRESENKKKKAEEARRIKMERKVSTSGISESRVGMRAYAKGRTYDGERYPETPYHDPDDIIREQRAARAQQRQELEEQKKQAETAQPRKKKKKGEEELPQGMVLNGQREAGDLPEPTPLTEPEADETMDANPETDASDSGEE